jgi:hypothetical protein
LQTTGEGPHPSKQPQPEAMLLGWHPQAAGGVHTIGQTSLLSLVLVLVLSLSLVLVLSLVLSPGL